MAAWNASSPSAAAQHGANRTTYQRLARNSVANAGSGYRPRPPSARLASIFWRRLSTGIEPSDRARFPTTVSRITTWLISTMRTSPMRPKTRSSGERQQFSMSRFATWSRSAIRRACTFGSSANLASHIHLFPRPLRHLNALPRPYLRSAYVSNPTAACTLRRLLASAICSRYACGLIHGARSLASLGSSPMLFDAGLSSSLTAAGTVKRVFIPLRITGWRRQR
jgi:hypothetical protein